MAFLSNAQAKQDDQKTKIWRCFWCDGEFTTYDQACIHFGAPHGGQPYPRCEKMNQEMNTLIAEVLRCHQEIERLKRVLTRLNGEISINRCNEIIEAALQGDPPQEAS